MWVCKVVATKDLLTNNMKEFDKSQHKRALISGWAKAKIRNITQLTEEPRLICKRKGDQKYSLTSVLTSNTEKTREHETRKRQPAPAIPLSYCTSWEEPNGDGSQGGMTRSWPKCWSDLQSVSWIRHHTWKTFHSHMHIHTHTHRDLDSPASHNRTLVSHQLAWIRLS